MASLETTPVQLEMWMHAMQRTEWCVVVVMVVAAVAVAFAENLTAHWIL